MKLHYKMESILLIITTVLCTILIINLVYKLRSLLKYPVNCWFCNNNFWVKFLERNSWTCPKCEQYNGFTKDGDYNKPIITSASEPVVTCKTSQVFARTPPKNGLCKMCNINQQLKVAQLANFVPMNEKKFDEEIENYQNQLEKAYRLCSPCKKVLMSKLHREKEVFLGSKWLENRSPEKALERNANQNTTMRSLINNTSFLIAIVLTILVSIEIFAYVKRNKDLFITLTSIKDIISGFVERLVNIIKMKLLLTFPILEKYFYNVSDICNLSFLPNIQYYDNDLIKLEDINDITQKSLAGFVCLIQIVGHLWSINNIKHTIFIDSLWTVFTTTFIASNYVAIEPIQMSITKFLSILSVLSIYIYMEKNTTTVHKSHSPTNNKVRNLTSEYTKSVFGDEDTSIETDDDVSLSKFGLHNYTEPSNEAVSPLNSSAMSGRCFTPRNIDMWSNPTLNSTFCINPAIIKTPSSVTETVFSKPSFAKYQNLAKSDSDSELDESISCLSIGSPKKIKQKINPIFSLRKFTPSPNFVAPSPLTRARPLISPSKLGHSTSWVAGGYWGSDGERQSLNIDGSRSSSQSSGFESQTSSMNQRNVFSQPTSREESVYGEPYKAPTMDRFQNFNAKNYTGPPQHVISPVFPQMQYNNHVHIPQPRFTPSNGVSSNVFSQQHVQNSAFKPPLGLINLPQLNTFSAR